MWIDVVGMWCTIWNRLCAEIEVSGDQLSLRHFLWSACSKCFWTRFAMWMYARGGERVYLAGSHHGLWINCISKLSYEVYKMNWILIWSWIMFYGRQLAKYFSYDFMKWIFLLLLNLISDMIMEMWHEAIVPCFK